MALRFTCSFLLPSDFRQIYLLRLANANFEDNKMGLINGLSAWSFTSFYVSKLRLGRQTAARGLELVNLRPKPRCLGFLTEVDNDEGGKGKKL